MEVLVRQSRDTDLREMARIWNIVVEDGKAFPQVDTIPELEEQALITKRRPNGSIICTNTMDEIATPGRIDY